MSASQGRREESLLPAILSSPHTALQHTDVLQGPLPSAVFLSVFSLSPLSQQLSHPAQLASPHLSLNRFSPIVAVILPPSSLSSPVLSLCCFLSSDFLCFSVSPLRLDPAPTASALTPRAGTGPTVPPARCSRTFITFSDDATFEEWFPQGRPPKVPVREVCPVTHRPALYRDPVTDIPYATARAFKIIREAYKKYITAHGLPPTASALGPGPPPPEPLPGSGPRALRQKIVIK